jgi:hypothetical protein
MIPTWMIEDLERRQREREGRRRPQLSIELPVRKDDEPSPALVPSVPIVIEFGEEALSA